MKVRKLIPLFLILVLSVQFLPLQRIAAWLTSGQVTEEMAHGLNAPKGKSLSFENDPPLLFASHNYGSQNLHSSILKKYHYDESLQIRLADEILTPPPNE